MPRGPVEFVQFLRLFDALGDGWLGLVVIGVLAGFLVRFTTSAERQVGFWSTCALGIAGALLGSWIGQRLGLVLLDPGPRFLAALGGSVLLTLAGSLLRRSRRRPAPEP